MSLSEFVKMRRMCALARSRMCVTIKWMLLASSPMPYSPSNMNNMAQNVWIRKYIRRLIVVVIFEMMMKKRKRNADGKIAPKIHRLT